MQDQQTRPNSSKYRRVLTHDPAKEYQAACEWNDNHIAGTRVIVTLDSGIPMETITTSAAWLVGGVAIIKVSGISGGYRLSRVTVARPEPVAEEKLRPCPVRSRLEVEP